jgi:hypothetical protein
MNNTANHRKQYVLRHEAVSMGMETISVAVVVSKEKHAKIEQAQDRAHLVTMTMWLKSNPGLYRMTKMLIDALAETSDVVIDDEDSGIATNPPSVWWSMHAALNTHQQTAKATVTHTLSRLMLTRPQYTHKTDTSQSTCTYDVVCPTPTNGSSYDVGGWWSAFAYISKTGQEHDYKKANMLYQPHPRDHTTQLHRADKDMCGPDADEMRILSEHKQAIVSTDMYSSYKSLHYVVVTIHELTGLMHAIQQPDFESIAQLKKWMRTSRGMSTYLKSIENTVNDSAFTCVDGTSSHASTLIAVIQRQTPAACGDRVEWIGEEMPWCAFVCKDKDNVSNYYVAGALTLSGDKKDGVHIINMPVTFPERAKHYINQRDIDYHEYVFSNYRHGNYVQERHYAVILTLNELKTLLENLEKEYQRQRQYDF